MPAALFFLNFASTLQSNLRTKKKMTKLVDRQAELDDLLIIADVYLKMNNRAQAMASITHLEQLAEELGNNLCEFVIFKCQVLRFLCDLAAHTETSEPPANLAQKHQDSLIALQQYAQKAFVAEKNPEANEAATQLLASCCHAYCAEFGYASETLQASFFALESSFLAQPLVMAESWTKILLQVEQNARAEASWGLILKGLLRVKSSILGEDLKALVSCLWNKVCKCFKNGAHDDAKVVAEYLYEFVLDGNAFLRSKALLALSFLITTTTVASTNSKDLQRALAMVNSLIDAGDVHKNLARMIKLRLLIRTSAPYINLVNEMIAEKVPVDECILHAVHELQSQGMLESAGELLDKLLSTEAVVKRISAQLVKERVTLLFLSNNLSPVDMVFQESTERRGNRQSKALPNVAICEEFLRIVGKVQAQTGQVSAVEEKERAAMEWIEACGWNLSLVMHQRLRETKLACMVRCEQRRNLSASFMICVQLTRNFFVSTMLEGIQLVPMCVNHFTSCAFVLNYLWVV